MEHRKQIKVSSKQSKTPVDSLLPKDICKKRSKKQPAACGSASQEISVSEPVLTVSEPVLEPNSSSDCSDVEESDDICWKCNKLYNEDEEWIGCDFCLKWFHRQCCGLTSASAWKAVSKSKAKYACPDCK